MTQTSAPPAPPTSDPPQAVRRRRIWPRVLVAVASLLVIVLGAGAVYVFSIERSIIQNINRGLDLPGDQPSTPGDARPTKEPLETGTLNYVLLGSDSRDPDNTGNGRSDTIMVVHLNAKRNQAYVISLPRDMYVTIPGHGRNKINAAYAFGGVSLTVRTLEKLTGVRMDHVILVVDDAKLAELGKAMKTDTMSEYVMKYPQG